MYKIKLRTAGYRLAYEVIDDEIIVYVLAIGNVIKGLPRNQKAFM